MRIAWGVRAVVFPGLVLALGACQGFPAAKPPRDLDVPYVPTSQDVVETMLQMAEAKPGDVLYDLGSGDGRIVVAAVRGFGVARGVGVDLNPVRVREARRNAADAGVSDRTRFVEGNVFNFDFSEATVVTMYLLEDVNLKLRPKVLALRPGTRVVSHQFSMGGWEPDRWVRQRNSDIMLWTVPARVAGVWQSGPYRLELRQRFQNVSGSMQKGTQRAAIDRTRLTGDALSFRVNFGGRVIDFKGKISGETIVATVGGEAALFRRTQ